MTQVIMVPPSTVAPPPPLQGAVPLPSMVPPAAPKPQMAWDAPELRDVVVKFMNDPRFAGMARYVANVRFAWSHAIQTACAGHGFIFFNPDFYLSIPEETRKTVVAHEIYHLILKHLERSEGHDPQVHNQAADHVINLGLEDDGFTFDGTQPLKDTAYRGMSTEAIYNTLYEKRDKLAPSPDYVPAQTIEDMIEDILEQDGEDKSLNQQKDDAEDDVDSYNSAPGKTPGSLQRVLEYDKNLIIQTGKTYNDIFQKYLIDPLSGGKRTFMRPNRRQHALGKKLLLPGRFPKRGHLNRLTHLVYALDVSGSITSAQATQFNNSVGEIKRLLNPEFLTVMFFDTRIVLERTFSDKENYTTIQVNAGGGTDLKPVYTRTAQLQPEALVIFTDLCVDIPKERDWDTIWLVPKNVYVPPGLYGELYMIPEKTK